jgi:hypothetical protein
MLFREKISVLRTTQNAEMRCVGRTQNFWTLKLVVDEVTTRLWQGLLKFKFSLIVLYEWFLCKQKVNVAGYHHPRNQLTLA